MATEPIPVVVWTDDPGAHAFLAEEHPQIDLRVLTDRNAYDEAVGAAEVIYLGRRHDRSFLAGAARLRWLHVAAAGVDQLGDLSTLGPEVTVTNMPGLNGGMMADYCMCALMMLTWDMPLLLAQQRDGRWRSRRSERLEGKTLLILGLGHVGGALVGRARAAGLEVIGLRRSGAAVPGVTRVYRPDALHEALGRADHVACTLPATPATRGLLDRAAFAAMKRSAFLVNVGRGAVIDEADLVAALAAGEIAGAALDVFAQEPLPPDSPLWRAERLLVTPHVSGFSADYRARAARVFADNLARYLGGLPPENVIDADRGY